MKFKLQGVALTVLNELHEGPEAHLFQDEKRPTPRHQWLGREHVANLPWLRGHSGGVSKAMQDPD